MPAKEDKKKASMAAAIAGAGDPGESKMKHEDPEKKEKGKGKKDKKDAKDEGDKGDKTDKDKKGKELKVDSTKSKLLKEVVTEVEEESEPEKTPSMLLREEMELRALARKMRFKRRWPEITKAKFRTIPWHPPPPPQRPPPVIIDRPDLVTRPWKPPYLRRRKPRPRLARILLEEITRPPPRDVSKLKKIWHNFCQVDRNKMMLQGSIGCNSKKYSSTHCGAQTGCIAVACRALLDEKSPAEFVKRDVDEIIETGDNYYKQCMIALKCYKGKPALQLHQLLPSFFYNDTKYTVKLLETDQVLLAKTQDNVKDTDLMMLMEKRQGQTYMQILSIGETRHFLIWGHPPAPESGSTAKTICYIFDPHMLNEIGGVEVYKLKIGGAFIRYAGIHSFVIDFLANYANMGDKTKPQPTATLTSIEIVQKEPLLRAPSYGLDLKALKIHCLSEWDSLNVQSLIEKKRNEGQYPLASLSAVSLATSRGHPRKKVGEFYQFTTPKETLPDLPVRPEAPPVMTTEQVMSFRGENFFLYAPKLDAHMFGRDDMVPLPKEEPVLHSPVDLATNNYHSQYKHVDTEKWILRGTRHFASYRYQLFKIYTGVACCVAALGMLQRYRARAWNEDMFDETLDVGWNMFRESLVERGGPVRRLVLGELKDTFSIRDREYKQKVRGIAVWGKLVSSNPKVYDLCRGIEHFFRESDAGILQIPGEYETAIWYEGGKYYLYHPWPADKYGNRVGLQDGGKGCVVYFPRVTLLCDYFMDNVSNMKKKPFSISDVQVTMQSKDMQSTEPVNKMKPIAPGRWIVRGSFHEADARFPEEHRGRQGTPNAITALAMATVVDPNEWTSDDVDETLVRGDQLYQSTMENLEKMGISMDQPPTPEEGPEEENSSGEEHVTGTLAAADVLTRFKVSDFDCIETDVGDSTFIGTLNPDADADAPHLKPVLKQFFKEHTHGVFTARGASVAIWKHDGHFFFFDPHGCDENGLPSGEPRSSACLVRIKGTVGQLADVLLGNLAPGSDDSFNISPVSISATKLNPEIGAPNTKLENKQYQWINKGTAAILMGPRGENAAIGKAAERCGVVAKPPPPPPFAQSSPSNPMMMPPPRPVVPNPDEDMAGRKLGLTAAAAFCAASESVPPPHMHQDHMFNFLEAGADYYLNHLKKTGRKDITVEDLGEKFEMGANTFHIELGEPMKLPLRLPDEMPGEGEGGGDEKEGLGEGEVEEPEFKHMKDFLFKMWYDNTHPTSISLLVGDYHHLGLWMSVGGKVVAFDPAPTLTKGLLTSNRIKKGDELRLQRLRDEMTGEAAGDEDDEEGGEGEEKPEPEPEFVPPESCPVIIVAASPGEFIDKLVKQGNLDNKQAIAPYKLYPVKVLNELTSHLKEKKGPGAAKEKAEGEEETSPEEELVTALEDSVMGKYMERLSRSVASVRARLAQNENYFLDQPNRDNQDAANCVMGIVVEHIEPYPYWKPELLDAVLKYGDRLHTMSLGRAKHPPRLKPSEMVEDFHVTNFNVKLEITPDVVSGDLKAGETGPVTSLKKAIEHFFESHKHGVLCAKGYCVALWRGSDGASYLMLEPHAVGPAGRLNPAGAATLVLFADLDELVNTFKLNVETTMRPGDNKFTISAVKVFWEYSKMADMVTSQGAVPDEGYEWKVLTAFVETARGRTILRGTRPNDLIRFTRDALIQSACGAIVGGAMSQVRRPHLWTRRTVDEIMTVGCRLFSVSVDSLGYEFRPGEDILLPLQLLKRFVLGVNYVRYDLLEVCTGKLELEREAGHTTLRLGLERFFETHTHGILWSVPYAVCIWRVRGAPQFYMFEPHACGPTGLRIDALDDGAACLLTFTSHKLMAFAYLQNIPVHERSRRDFVIYAIKMEIKPIQKLNEIPPLVKAAPGVQVVPATSKVGVDGRKRRADEEDRAHPPGSATCMDAQRAADVTDKEQGRLAGAKRNASGWLVLRDGTQFLSAGHSIACRKFSYSSRGNQALSCAMMAVAMSRIENPCVWCSTTLDQILESGDQLYQDSYLHFHPPTKVLSMEQILRKFYTPGNCVCRVVVYKPRQTGVVDNNLLELITEFFREEKQGVLVAGPGDFAVALFRNPRGYYMFDPQDRDRYGRAVAPPCLGKARACFSLYPDIPALTATLGPNIPPTLEKEGSKIADANEPPNPMSEIRFNEPTAFTIYGMDITHLRRLNEHER